MFTFTGACSAQISSLVLFSLVSCYQVYYNVTKFVLYIQPYVDTQSNNNAEFVRILSFPTPRFQETHVCPKYSPRSLVEERVQDEAEHVPADHSEDKPGRGSFLDDAEQMTKDVAILKAKS